MVASHLTSDLTGHCHQYVFHAIELSFDLSTWAVSTVCAPGSTKRRTKDTVGLDGDTDL